MLSGAYGTAASLAACVFSVLFAPPAVAQRVTVTPDRTTIGLQETLNLRIVMQGRFDDVRGPDLSDFEVVGKSTGTSISVIGGVVQQEQRVDLALQPRRAGRLRIGGVELLAGGRVVATAPAQTIQVLEKGSPAPSPSPPGPPPPSGPPAPEQEVEPQSEPEPRIGSAAPPESYAGRPAFLWVRVPERTLYVGEPVYVEYVLFVRSNMPVQGVRSEGMPDFKGFVVEQPPRTEDQGRRVRVRGVPYDAYVQWRGALAALGPGRAVLPPMSLILSIGDLFTERRIRVANDPVALDFQEPPADGRPADYVPGTVGQFVVHATLDHAKIRVGESAVLSIQVTGSGNLRALKVPDIVVPAGLKVSRVPSSDLDERVVDAGGISGRRLFQYLLTAEAEGEYEIPRVSLAFFNPLTGRYERTRSDVLKLTVAGHATGGPVHEVEAAPPRVVDILASSDLSAPPPPPSRVLDPVLVQVGIAMPVFVFGVAEAAVRLRESRIRNEADRRRRRALAEAQKELRRLARDPSSDSFWAQVDRVIREFVRARFGVSADQADLAKALLRSGASPDAIEALLAELDACAFGRFAPSAAQDRDRAATLQRVRACLAALDRAP